MRTGIKTKQNEGERGEEGIWPKRRRRGPGLAHVSFQSGHRTCTNRTERNRTERNQDVKSLSFRKWNGSREDDKTRTNRNKRIVDGGSGNGQVREFKSIEGSERFSPKQVGVKPERDGPEGLWKVKAGWNGAERGIICSRAERSGTFNGNGLRAEHSGTVQSERDGPERPAVSEPERNVHSHLWCNQAERCGKNKGGGSKARWSGTTRADEFSVRGWWGQWAV